MIHTKDFWWKIAPKSPNFKKKNYEIASFQP